MIAVPQYKDRVAPQGPSVITEIMGRPDKPGDDDQEEKITLPSQA